MNQKHICNIILFDIWRKILISMIFYTQEMISPDNIICMTWALSSRKQSQISVSIDQSHRYGRPEAACHEPAGSYDKTTRTAICFEHKTQYLLIRAPYIPALWYFGTSVTYPPWFRWVKLVVIPPPMFYIAATFVKYCYTTGSWLL